MKVIIAEKPSIARAIQSALATEGEHFTSVEGEYSKSEHYYVTSQFGHLLELLMPEEYSQISDGERAPLPFFPSEYQFKVKKDCIKRFNTIKKLVHQDDVTEIIHCGDDDREGQLLIDLVLEQAENTKPVTRPHIIALSTPAILGALKKKSNNAAFKNIRNEGYARMILDYAYGINLSRYATGKSAATSALNVGRVKGAILNELYLREMAITKFVSVPYFQAVSVCSDLKLTAKPKFDTEAECIAFADKLQGRKTVVQEVTVAPTTKRRPKLFSQTTLQGFMSNKYAYTPDQTLALTQSLYEQGYVTYPRTDSEYMPESEKKLVRSIINSLNTANDLKMREDKGIFDDSKVDSHSAIIVTGKQPQTLKEDQRNCYLAILNRMKAAFCSEECIYEKTTYLLKNADASSSEDDIEYFTVTGERLLSSGWQTFEPPKKKSIDAKADSDEDEISPVNLPKLEEGELVKTDFKSVQKKTEPPKRHTVTSLGEWMKNPFKQECKKANAEDDADDYANILAGLQIGTTATRAPILKTLEEKDYLEIKKSSYRITDKGIFLVEACQELGINFSKEKTASLGKELKDIGKGKRPYIEIINNEQEHIKAIIDADNSCKLMLDVIDTDLGACPKCGKPIISGKKAYGCSGWKLGCDFKVWKVIAGKTIPQSCIKTLVTDGVTQEIKGFKSKEGKSFAAKLQLSEDKEVKFLFANENVEANYLGKCPLCGKPIVAGSKAYGCTGWKDDGCDFKIWKTIAGKNISPEHVKTILEKGSTSKLSGFKSKAGKSFSAKVALTADKKGAELVFK